LGPLISARRLRGADAPISAFVIRLTPETISRMSTARKTRVYQSD